MVASTPFELRRVKRSTGVPSFVAPKDFFPMWRWPSFASSGAGGGAEAQPSRHPATAVRREVRFKRLDILGTVWLFIRLTQLAFCSGFRSGLAGNHADWHWERKALYIVFKMDIRSAES